MSDDLDIQNIKGKQRKRPLSPASSSENSNSGSPLTTSKRSRKQLVTKSEDESSSSENEEINPVRSRHGASKVLSDYETGESNEEDDGILTDSSEGPSDNEGVSKHQLATKKTKLDAFASDSSSDSDGASEKCPICLLKFSTQEIGTPEACDHYFCAVCIQEWAKNVNTCPVDRQPFTLILVRQNIEGKVIRQIPVIIPNDNQEVLEDPTFCEVCGLCDQEDRLLLCDLCDQGYHMNCLNPPLEHVPIDEWYCPECAPLRNPLRGRGGRALIQENDVVSEEARDYLVADSRSRPTPRMLPRTRQSERVQRNLRTRNVPFRQVPNSLQMLVSSGIESMEGESSERQRGQRGRRNKRRTNRSKFRIKRIVTDDGVVEVRVKRKKSKKYRKKRKSRTLRHAPRTAKGRLANRLGMCIPRIPQQAIPETTNRQQELRNAPINHQRHQAGIPTLDIFGRREQLDYFSGSEFEENDELVEGGVGILSRVRVAHPSDRLIRRKKAASVLCATSSKKSLNIEKMALPASGSLLDTILDSQTLWHSKKAEIKSSSDGSLQVLLPKNSSSEIFKEKNKIDVKTSTVPVIEAPMYPGGRVNTGTYRHSNSNRGGSNRGVSRSNAEQSYEGSSYQSSGPREAGFTSSYDNNVGSAPTRGVAPIRFRMNVPPRRPNIHSYPSDNIPPPPPLRLRSPLVEMSFPATNSPESSPSRDEEEIDIYSDIEQENSSAETEEKTFGTLEPPPEPPFLMTMEPPPEPPAMLMNLNDDASDDEPSGLVIDDPPPGDVYDPCASDDSSTGDAPLAKPPEVPMALKDPELVANYSSDSGPSTDTPSYNPELPTYSSTPIIGPLPRPDSHNSSEAEDNDEECPNFSMYSAASMHLALRGLPVPITDLDIPIPPPVEKEASLSKTVIPLPEADSLQLTDKEGSLDIPIPESIDINTITSDNNDQISDSVKTPEEEISDSAKDDEGNVEANKIIVEVENAESKKFSLVDDAEEDDGDDEDEGDDEDNEIEDTGDDNDSEGRNSNQGDVEKVSKAKTIKLKGSSEAGEDECSTQGDVLDLAIESEANLENNLPPDDSEEQLEAIEAKSLEEFNNDEQMIDGGDKSDGLVDITDEEMSVYDGQEIGDDLEKSDEHILGSDYRDKIGNKSLDSEDDNSLVGGATSAVSAGTLNNSDNILPPTLPGLEGLETETISESEDVNFDELTLEGNEHPEVLANEEDLSLSKKKKKKKNRKVSHTEDSAGKGNNEPLEFEEGEIIEDKPKQLPKKDKKIKPKSDNGAEVDENVTTNKPKTPNIEKDTVEKKVKKKKDKSSLTKDKNDKGKELKEKSLKAGQVDENVSWKKLSKSTKERNYRDGKEKEEKDRENKEESLSRKEKRNKEKRKELERYDVRRLISEKPKQPKKDEFGRDISPSKSGSSLSPYRPPRYRSPLRTRNRSRTRSRSWKSRSRSRERRRRSRSRDKVRSRDRSRRTRSRDRSRRNSRSRNKVVNRSREVRKTPDKTSKGDKAKTGNRSISRTRKKSRSLSAHSRRNRSLSYSRSWTPSWSKSSMSRSQSRGRRRSQSVSRSKSRSWAREQNVSSLRSGRTKDPPKNLTVIVTNKDALKKKEKKKPSKKKDDRRKKKRGQSPAPSKEVFTSGDNILVSVNFKNANKNPELIPATTPLLRESSKRKRDDQETSAKKKKTNSSSKKTPGLKKSNRLAKINEATRNAKPVAIIDLDLSPFREQTPSPKEVIILSDSGDEGEKQHSEMQDERDRMGLSGMNQSMLSLSSGDLNKKNSLSQPESPVSSSFMLNSSGPKTPPEPHIKFSISTKPSQIRLLTNPLMEAEEEMHDENIENDDSEIVHKGPNTPPEPPPELNTPASPPTTPYDPFDPTKSRSPSPQPRGSETALQLNSSRDDKDGMPTDDDDDHPRTIELRSSTPPNTESEELKKTPESTKVHSTPKSDPNNTDGSPKVSPPVGTLEPSNKLPEDTLMKPIQKLLASANKLDVTVHKSPEKLITVVISQQVKNINQTPKQAVQPLKVMTPNKHQTPKGNVKHQIFSNSLVKQVPILGTLLPGPAIYTPTTILTSGNKAGGRVQHNGDPSDDMDIDPSSPYSPGSSEGDDLFEPPVATPPKNSAKLTNKSKSSSGNKFDSLFGSSPAKPRHGRHSAKARKGIKPKGKGNKKEEVKVKLDEDQLKILDELPSSAVEMQVKDKFLKKLNRQERVVEEVKLVLKPHYAKKHINKEEYKEILRRSVPKICHNKSGEINPIKIQFLIEAYVKKFRYAKKKVTGTTLPNAGQNKPKPQKTLWS